MPKDLTEKFMKALQQAENQRDPTPLLELYADDSTTENLAMHEMTGKDGAREFWQKYLDNFQEIHSEFHARTDDDVRGVMEWVSRGKLSSGEPIEYRGVSVIEAEGGKVKRFRTYYDSAAFVNEAGTT